MNSYRFFDDPVTAVSLNAVSDADPDTALQNCDIGLLFPFLIE